MNLVWFDSKGEFYFLQQIGFVGIQTTVTDPLSPQKKFHTKNGRIEISKRHFAILWIIWVARLTNINASFRKASFFKANEGMLRNIYWLFRRRKFHC